MSLAVPPLARGDGVGGVAASVFDEGDFVAGVERMVMFRPKLKKTDGDAYIKELVGQIKASKETLKMMLHKKDQLVDACKDGRGRVGVRPALGGGDGGVAQSTLANVTDANANIGSSSAATAEELQRVQDEKARLHRQNETLQQNLGED